MLTGWVAVAGASGTLPFRSADIRFGVALDDPVAWRVAHTAAAPWFAATVVFVLAGAAVWLPWSVDAVGGIVLGLIAVGVVALIGAGLVGNSAAARAHDRSGERGHVT